MTRRWANRPLALCPVPEYAKKSDLTASKPDAILIGDFESAYFSDVNESGCELFGYRGRVWSGVKGRDLHPESESEGVDRFSAELVETGRAWSPKIRMKTKDGRLFWGDLRVSVYEASGQKLIMTLVRDVSERVRLLGEIQRSHDDTPPPRMQPNHRAKQKVGFLRT